jgi:peptide/nickel transport system permease protein
MLRFDWGLSVAYHRPAAALVWERGLNTLVLTTTVTILAWLTSLTVVVWAAAGGYWRNFLLRGFVSFTMALPELVVVIGLSLLAAETKWFPAGGMTSLAYISGTSFQRLMDIAFHMVLPGTALLIATMPVVILHASTAVAEVLDTPFITAARANGIPRLRLLLRHVLPVAANPLITLAGFSVGTLLSSALIVEAVSGWPGLGHLLLQSILQRDLNLVVAVVLFSAALLLIANLSADLLLYAADPRIRGSS